MDEALLSYYNRELAYLRKQGAEFAEKHPKIAGRLRLDKDTVEDPHVSRLIESFAFLTARVRHKLDDGFPELTEALMGVLYPDYQAPVPSLSIVRLQNIPDSPETHHVPAGTQLYTDAHPQGTCYYHTCFDTEVLPLRVAEAEFAAQPYRAPNLPVRERRQGSQAVLRLKLRSEDGAPLAELAPQRLRFFINGQPQLSFRLYEYLLQRVAGLALARHPNDPQAVFLPPECLRPCGLSDAEAALPADGRSSSAHRLLCEYFAFPQKFLFVELDGLEAAWDGLGEEATLYVYFTESHNELIQGVGAETLQLGCTPAVNLFPMGLEHLAAAELGYETRLAADSTHASWADIHTLQRVYARDGNGRQIELQPFYGAHRGEDGADTLYWHSRREVSQWYGGHVSRGSDTYLSFVDRDFRVGAPDGDWLIGGRALCTNRDLPDKLPFGPGQPAMDFSEGGAGLQVRCITAPTATVQPHLEDASRWQLVTQLSLHSFTGEDGLDVLRETLRLYDFRQVPETRAIIDGIVGLRAGLTTARVRRDGRAAICQGTYLELELDAQYYSGTGLYLFTAILSEFFAQYCTVNTFVQLSVHVRQRQGSVIQWPPRSGKQALI